MHSRNRSQLLMQRPVLQERHKLTQGKFIIVQQVEPSHVSPPHCFTYNKRGLHVGDQVRVQRCGHPPLGQLAGHRQGQGGGAEGRAVSCCMPGTRSEGMKESTQFIASQC
ncbi:hypothetical protein ElyMa_003285200 [Elysia marginata]|uniref:Uncharacterized protein n=1 Tax=Elysia marginata TaxID=1093978 RepID=A0AAV4JD35_9GAST|nr:hypothetical protein ElyMa_003285200 [Elysia marginata]